MGNCQFINEFGNVIPNVNLFKCGNITFVDNVILFQILKDKRIATFESLLGKLNPDQNELADLMQYAFYDGKKPNIRSSSDAVLWVGIIIQVLSGAMNSGLAKPARDLDTTVDARSLLRAVRALHSKKSYTLGSHWTNLINDWIARNLKHSLIIVQIQNAGNRISLFKNDVQAQNLITSLEAEEAVSNACFLSSRTNSASLSQLSQALLLGSTPRAMVWGFNNVGSDECAFSSSMTGFSQNIFEFSFETLSSKLTETVNALGSKFPRMSTQVELLTPKERGTIINESADILKGLAPTNDRIPDVMVEVQTQLDEDLVTLTQDPQSPYHGMTPQQVQYIMTKSVFGLEFTNDLATRVQRVLNSMISNYIHCEYIDKEISLIGATPPQLLEAIRGGKGKMESNTIELVEMSKKLFSVNTSLIEDAGISLRSNAAPLVILELTVKRVLLATALAALALSAFVNSCAKDVELTCIKLKEALKLLIERHERTLELQRSKTDPQEIQTNIQIVLNSVRDELQRLEGHPNADDCYAQVAIPALTEFLKKCENQSLETCISELQSVNKSIEASIKLSEAELARLEAEDWYTQFKKFAADVFNTLNTVAKFAAFTALGYFAIWGGMKVYRSYKETRDLRV